MSKALQCTSLALSGIQHTTFYWENKKRVISNSVAVYVQWAGCYVDGSDTAFAVQAQRHARLYVFVFMHTQRLQHA